MNIKEDTLYEATFPNGDKCMVQLAKIQEYNATGMQSDYIFQCLSPEFSLLKNSSIEGGFFIPSSVIDKIQFREVRDSVYIMLFKPTKPFEVKFKR